MTSFAMAALFARQLLAELPVQAHGERNALDRKLVRQRTDQVRKLFFQLAANSDDIIEIGAHHAEASVQFVSERPGRRAFAYEANPEICAEAAAMHAGKPIEFFNIALGDRKGTASFFVPVGARYKQWASLKQRQKDTVDQVEITVPMQTLDAAIAATGAGRSVIWIDVEGAQMDVFSKGKKFLKSSVDAIYMELYDKKMFSDCPSSIDMLAFLIDCGFIPVARDNQFPDAYNLVAVNAQTYADNLERIVKFMARTA